MPPEAAAQLIISIVSLVFSLPMIAGMWATFSKAGAPGWASLVPLYNMVVLMEISGKPVWWILLFFVPLVNLIVAGSTYTSLAENFGKGQGFAMGLLFLPWIFFPILGFGSAEYLGDSGRGGKGGGGGRRREPEPIAEPLPHELGPPVEFQPVGKDKDAAQTRMVQARQSADYIQVKELVADMVDRRAERAMLDYTAEMAAVRYEIDGVWHSLDSREREPADNLLAVLKHMCGLNPADRRSRQEGEFKCKYNKKKYDGKVQSQGTPTGERVVLSIDYGLPCKTLDELGMRAKLRESFVKHVRADKGMILVSAMPGGGLSTAWAVTLLSTDRYIKDFIAIEDKAKPNFEIENVAVETYDLAAGQTPDKLIPPILLRQPDVLVVPEPPNAETIRVLCDEVNGGRLVFSSIRAKDAIEALLRVLLLKAPAAPFAKAITCVINTRLLRRLCPKCKQAFEAPPQLLQRLGIPPGRVQVLYQEYQPPPPPEDPKKAEEIPEPCRDCGGIGYKGRIAIVEMLEVNDTIRELLVKQPKLELLRQAAQAAGYRSAQEEGILLVAQGITSIQELQRALRT